MTPSADLNAMARRVIDANHYMTVATQDPDGQARLSPVYYTAARYSDLYWISSPDAHHSRNLVARPEVKIVIFDSTALVGEGEAVYLQAAGCGSTSRALPRARCTCPVATRSTAAESTPARPRTRPPELAIRSCS